MKKICANCKKEKSISEFWVRKRAKDGFNSSCKNCVRVQNSNSYKNHWTKNRKRIDSNHYKKVEELREFVNQIKHEKTCYFCQEDEPVCLQFHHTNPTNKYAAVSSLVNRKQKNKILIEIEKCVVVCANCHLKLHGGLLSLS